MTDDFIVFVAARLDEEEAALREAIDQGRYAGHDPDRVLRYVEARRKILAEYNADSANGETPDYYAGLAFTIKALAAFWSDHPDYREEWKL